MLNQENKSEINKKKLLVLLAALENGLDNFFYLVELETKLAKRSLKILGFSFLLIGLLLFTTWFFLMIAFAFYLFSMGLSLVLSFLSVVILNVILTGPIYFLIKKHTRRLTFPITRRQINKTILTLKK